MAEERKIIAYKVVVNTDDLDRSANAAAERVDMLKQKQKELDKTTDSGRIAYQKYNAEIKKAQGDLRKFTELQKKQIVVNESLEGSNEQLRAQLSLVTAQYNALSKEQRENTEEGQKLKQQVSDLTATLKENESAVGDNRRNVGNYKESIVEAANELKINSAFTDQNTKANLELSSQMERSARSATAIAGTFSLLSNVIGDNEEAQAALQKITLAVTAATVLSNLAKEKGAILDTIAFVKTKALTAAQTAYTLAVRGTTLAMQGLKAAIVATGIGALIVGVTTLIQKLKQNKEATDNQTDSQKELNKELEKTKSALDVVNDLYQDIEKVADRQAGKIERQIKLREAQGATEIELLQLEVDLLNQRNESIQGAINLAENLGDKEKENELLERQRDIVNDLTIAEIKLNEALDEQAAKNAAIFAEESDRIDGFFTNVTDRVAEFKELLESIGFSYETAADALVRVANEEMAEFNDILNQQMEEQNQAAQDFFEDELDRQEKRKEAIENLTNLSIEAGKQIGQAFSDSLTEAGFQAEEFARRLALLAIDGLEKAILVEIAKITAKQIAEKGFAGIATGAILTAVVTGAAATAKAALSKPVKFEQGGEFNPFGTDVGGRLHSQGGTKYYGQDGNVIELERGEKMFIANRKTSGLIRQIAALNVAMGGKGLSGASSYLQDGGFATRGISESVGGVFNQAQLAAQIVSNLPEFQVSVTEINRIQNKVSAVGNSMRL